jgi:phosphopantothenate--cysteine ligase
MRVLLTSGGTKVPIDRVRSITNMSRGTFGAKIARQLLLYPDVNLTYLGAKEFRMPFSVHEDFAASQNYEAIQTVVERAVQYTNCKERYCQITYKTFDDYAARLKGCFAADIHRPDVVILAAAVSDYIVPNPVDGKVRSTDNLAVQLEKAPKLIRQIKEWHPDCKLIGFKLLVDSNDEELILAARDSIDKNGCDLVVANDLRDIRAGKHRLLLVSDTIEEHHSREDDPEYLAGVVAKKAHELGQRT